MDFRDGFLVAIFVLKKSICKFHFEIHFVFGRGFASQNRVCEQGSRAQSCVARTVRVARAAQRARRASCLRLDSARVVFGRDLVPAPLWLAISGVCCRSGILFVSEKCRSKIHSFLVGVRLLRFLEMCLTLVAAPLAHHAGLQCGCISYATSSRTTSCLRYTRYTWSPGVTMRR